MLGRIRWEDRRKLFLEEERLLDLPLLTLTLPDRERGSERRLNRGVRLLRQRRVTRVLTPAGFDGWPALYERGLRAVDTAPLRCALVPAWVRASLEVKGVRPENAVLCLHGNRESPEMARSALALCPLVRGLVIDAPGGALAARLQREFGLPILPARSARAHLALTFDPSPNLTGKFTLQAARLPEGFDSLPLLAALWESGRVKTEDIQIEITT